MLIHPSRAGRALVSALLLLTLLTLLLAPVSIQADEAAFTILVYLCGTDLETGDGSASQDLLEMMAAGLGGDDVHVIVQTGGTYQWHLEGIDSGVTERWRVEDGIMSLVDSAAQQDMGRPDTLQAFVEYGLQAFPAERYGLILWDHGGGSVGGICTDEFTGNTLSMGDVCDALDGARETVGDLWFDFIGFDACLMATFEIAQNLSYYADYMVASEELEPGTGWEYTQWLSALVADPSIHTEDLLTGVVDSFLETSLRNDPDDLITLSVTDLAEIDGVREALEALSLDLAEALKDGGFGAISRQRQGMRGFGEYYSSVVTDMVDLRHMVEVYAQTTGADTAPFVEALERAVVYSRHSDNLDNISGLSILAPLKTRDLFDAYINAYDFGEEYPNYTRFITDMHAFLSGGDYVFSPAQPAAVGGQSLWGVMEAEGLAGTVSGASGSGWFGQGSGTTPSEGAAEEAIDPDAVYAYSLTLDDADMANLAYVEGNLMLDLSDEDGAFYVDLGYLQHAHIDWESNTIYSLFDGTWPVLEGQLVNMADQTVTGHSRRSIVDVTVNGEEVYLLVVFDASRPQGEVIGYTEGYTENGMPVRGHKLLYPGDVIVPMYDLLYWDEDGEMQAERFEGEPIEVTDAPLSFGYESLEEDEALDYVYAFCLNDIFGDYQFTDFIGFSL